MKFEFTVDLRDTPENIWQSIRTFRAVNAELFPVMQMTSPKNYTDKKFEDFPAGEYVFNSFVLFLGFLPMEVSKARLMEVVENVGFTENSKMLLAHNWIHERRLQASKGGCRLVDKLEVLPKVPLFEPIFYGFVKLVFWNRHRQLRRRFG